MVSLGHPNTLPVTVDEMLHHCRATARGAQKALIVGDLPFGSYEGSPEEAYSTALRFLKEGNVDAVKLEGGKQRADTVKKLVDGGIAVMGHVGLTPQSISVLGGFRAQGRTADAAAQVGQMNALLLSWVAFYYSSRRVVFHRFSTTPSLYKMLVHLL